HVVHGICPALTGRRKGFDVLAASYEGVSLIRRDETGHWLSRRLGEGFQKSTAGNKGASEVAMGALKESRFMVTVEPWHGHQVVLYVPGSDANKAWDRKLIDDHLRWGHAVRCADLDGDGADEIIV